MTAFRQAPPLAGAWASAPGSALLIAALQGLALLAAPGRAAPQEPFPGPASEATTEVARRGSAVALEAAGPALLGRPEIYRPTPALPLHHRWVFVQDSTLGVVFSSPSGIEAGLEGLEGELHLRALRETSAVEIRALVFNVWGDLAGYLAVTTFAERRAGDTFSAHPRRREPTPAVREHRTSIVWIHRVMSADESIAAAKLDAVAAAWAHVVGGDFPGLPEDAPLRAVAP